MITDAQVKERIEGMFGKDVSVQYITGGLSITLCGRSVAEMEIMPAVLSELAQIIYDWDAFDDVCISYRALPEENIYEIRYGDERVM